MSIHYSILFTVDVLHEYGRNGRCDDFDILPTADTQQLIKGMNLFWRKSGDRYFALAKAIAKGGGIYTPSVNTPPEKQFRQLFGKNVLRFYLALKNPLFYNYTNLDEKSRGKKYYFSNMAANKRAGTLFLSRAMANIAPGTAYVPGDMVMEPSTDRVFEAISKHTSTGAAQLADTALWQRKGLAFLAKELPVFTVGKTYQQGEWVLGRNNSGVKTNNVYEALKTKTAEAVTQLSEAAIWKSRGKGDLQYPSSADAVDYSTGSYLFPLPAAVRHAEISFFAFNHNAAAPAFDVPVGQITVQSYTEPQSNIPVDLSALKPGRYQVNVNGQSRTVYYDTTFSQANVIGIIEVFPHLPATSDYAFLTGDEDIHPAPYVLHFPARRVLWKYKRKDSRATAVKDTTDPAVYQFAIHGDDFVSTKPILLSQEAIDTLELSFSNGDAKIFPLPNPPVSRLGRFTQNGYDYFSTELFLNY